MAGAKTAGKTGIKDVRPTSSRVLLALFNILGTGTGLSGCNFLDLFAGTGRVGMTALERGANSVVWVESVRARAIAIERNLLEQDKNESALVLSLELRRAISWLLKRERTFDIIFADPPYHEGWGAEILNIRGIDKLLSPDGLFVIEHSIREELVMTPVWELVSQRDYGETRLSFLKVQAQVSQSKSAELAELKLECEQQGGQA